MEYETSIEDKETTISVWNNVLNKHEYIHHVQIRILGPKLTYRKAKKIFKDTYNYNINDGYGINPELNRYSIQLSLSETEMKGFKRHLILNEILK